MYSYKVINFQIRYKPLEYYSSPKSDEEIELDDQYNQEEKRIFEKIDYNTFMQIKLEFNSYLLPCNPGIYLS